MDDLHLQLRQAQEAATQAQKEANRYRTLVEHSENLLKLMSASGILLSYSAAAQPMLGYDQEVLLGTDCFDLVHPDDLLQVRAALDVVLTEGRVRTAAYRVRRADGSWCWIETTATNLLDDPHIQAIVLDSRDVTLKRQTEGLVQQVVSGARCLLWQAEVTQIEGSKREEALRQEEAPSEAQYEWQLTVVNPQAAQEFLPVSIPPGGTYTDGFWQAKVDEDLEDMYDIARTALDSGHSHYAQEYRVRCSTGELRWLHEDVHLEQVDTAHWHLVGVCIDITLLKSAEHLLKGFAERLESSHSELQQANLQLEYLSRTDGLTGLNNHRAFQESLDVQWQTALRYDTPLSLLLIDVDCFKQYNDEFGHPAGDQVLKIIAQALSGCARDTDFVARYGGEEFALVVPNTGAAGALKTAERIRSHIEKLSWPQRAITVSIGVATHTSQLNDRDQLVTEADRALYRAKARGRNRVEAAETSTEV